MNTTTASNYTFSTTYKAKRYRENGEVKEYPITIGYIPLIEGWDGTLTFSNFDNYGKNKD